MLAAAEEHAFLAADLAEEFDDPVATAGIAAARRWYWKQGCLLLRTFINLTSTAPGFDADGVITIRASMPPMPHADAAQVVAFQDSLRDAAGSLPGVTAAAHAMFIPFTPGSWGDGYRRAGTADATPRGPMAHFFMVRT